MKLNQLQLCHRLSKTVARLNRLITLIHNVDLKMNTLKQVLSYVLHHMNPVSSTLEVSVFLYDSSLFCPALTLLWPLHAIYLCITMNLRRHRGSYTLLTFITIIPIPVFPLSGSVSVRVYTFFSSRHYLSVYSGQGWIGKVRWVLATVGSFPPTHFSSFLPFPFVHFYRKTRERLSLEFQDTNGLSIPVFFSSTELYSSQTPLSNSSLKWA